MTISGGAAAATPANRRRSAAGLILALGLALPSPGPRPAGAQTGDGGAAGIGRLKVKLAPTEIAVGDRVEARITLVWTGPAPTSIPRFPAWQASWGPVEIVRAGAVDVVDQGARRVYRQTLLLTAFETGDVVLPGVTVRVAVDGEVMEISNEATIGFSVTSVLPDDAAEISPRPPAPPRRPAADRRFLWVLAVLAAAVWVMARRLTRRLAADPAAEPPEPAAAPLDELLQRLRQLDPAAAESAHTALSLGLRRFLGRSLGFRAAESTTSEIRHRLAATPVAEDVAEGTVLLLRDCDEVKFARQAVAPSLTGDRLSFGLELARRIDAGLAPPLPPEETAG